MAIKASSIFSEMVNGHLNTLCIWPKTIQYLNTFCIYPKTIQYIKYSFYIARDYSTSLYSFCLSRDYSTSLHSFCISIDYSYILNIFIFFLFVQIFLYTQHLYTLFEFLAKRIHRVKQKSLYKIYKTESPHINSVGRNAIFYTEPYIARDYSIP